MTTASRFQNLQVALVALALTLISPFAPAADAPASNHANWPRFRGPNGTGLGQANLPDTWTKSDYHWITQLPGGGNSSPTVWGDRIFLTCGNDVTGDFTVVCLNTSDGAIRWTRTFTSPAYKHNSINSYASCTPAVDEKYVYVCWSTPEELTMAALDHDGKDVWHTGLGTFVSQHGGGQSPVPFGDMVLLGDDNEGDLSFVFALDRNTGAQRWRAQRKASNKFAPATPCIFQPKTGGPQVIAMNKSQGFTALDPENGRTIWEFRPPGFDARPVASPYVADGLIFASCGDGPSGHLFAAVRPSSDGKSAELAYDFKKAAPYVPTSIVANGLVFAVTDNGILHCLKLDTGKELYKERLDSNFYGSFVCTGDKLLILSREGEAYVVAPTGEFKLLGRSKLELEDANAKRPPLSTTPAIADGRVYIRTYTHLACLAGAHGGVPSTP